MKACPGMAIYTPAAFPERSSRIVCDLISISCRDSEAFDGNFKNGGIQKYFFSNCKNITIKLFAMEIGHRFLSKT